MPSTTAGASPTPRHGGWWRPMGAASHRPHARSLRPSGSVSPRTPHKPSGQIPCQQVGWLRQRQCQSFNRLNTFYWPNFPQTQSSIGPKIPVQMLLLPKRGFLKRSSEAGFKPGSQKGSQSGSQAGSAAATEDALNVCQHYRSLSAVKTG